MHWTLYLFLLIVIPSGTLPATIHPERAQLLKDVLGWMTFRNKGQLMTPTQVEPLFLPVLENKYTSSDFYRSFVIAFLYGVVPRLTLNLNDPCDPAYTTKYKDSFNNSVTWHFQKKFTFESYDTIKTSPIKYCDYRQGLVCKSSTRTCQCPEGSKMEPIAAGNAVQRCLVQENEVCALIDIDHGPDRMHSALASNMYHLAFNLEKPPSCKDGTTCRFKSSNLATSLCYDVNSGPFAPPYTDSSGAVQNTWIIDFGRECTLGLYAIPGSCRVDNLIDTINPGYVCYNFGPPKSQKSSNPEMKKGFCAHEYGPYGIRAGGLWGSQNGQLYFLTYISPFIHPRTVPLRGQELEDYMRTYRSNARHLGGRVGGAWVGGSNQNFFEGDPCNEQRTKKWEDLWKYYSGLDKDPPPGKNYVPEATITELNTKLQEFITFAANSTKKFCKVFDHSHRPGIYDSSLYKYPSLKCETGYWDADGNDGKCKAPGNLDARERLAYSEKHQAALDHISDVEYQQEKESWSWRNDILREYPEFGVVDCSAGPSCPTGTICFPDYSDHRGIYDKSTCKLKQPLQKLIDYCHDSSDSLKYGKCEEKFMDEMVFDQFEKMVDYSKLERGKPCRYNLEDGIRSWIGKKKSTLNKYKMMTTLREERAIAATGGGQGFCDSTKLLGCMKNGICQCLDKTTTRSVTVDGIEYHSDCCYKSEGYCTYTDMIPKIAIVTASELKIAHQQYGDTGCNGKGNVCVFQQDVFLDRCTTNNTGDTGYDGVPDPPPPPPRPPPPPPEPITTEEEEMVTEDNHLEPVTGAGGPGYRFAGQAVDLQGSKLWILVGCSLTMILYFEI